MADEQRQSSAPSGPRPGGHGPGGGHGGPRRTQWPTSRRRPRRWSRRSAPRQAPVFPQKESLQVLCREDGLHRLQARRHPVAVRSGTRQDSAAPHDGRLRPPSALARRSHQARAQYRAASVRRKRRGFASSSSGWRSRSARRRQPRRPWFARPNSRGIASASRSARSIFAGTGRSSSACNSGCSSDASRRDASSARDSGRDRNTEVVGNC